MSICPTAPVHDDYLYCYAPCSSLSLQPGSNGAASQWLDETLPPKHFRANRTLVHAPACVACLLATGAAVACPMREGIAAHLVGDDKWEERCCAGCPWKHSKRCRRRNFEAALILEQSEVQNQTAPHHSLQQAVLGGGQHAGTTR